MLPIVQYCNIQSTTNFNHLHSFSRQLQPVEQRYRELLAVYLAMRHFHCILKSREFTVFPGHKHFTFTRGHTNTRCHLTHYTSDIRHIVGSASVPADALSMFPVCSLLSSVHIDLVAIATDQQPSLDSLDTSTHFTGCKFEYFSLPSAQCKILCDTSAGSPRPLVPGYYRRTAYDTLHSCRI